MSALWAVIGRRGGGCACSSIAKRIDPFADAGHRDVECSAVIFAAGAMKLVLIPQFQPGRYLLFVTLFAMMLAVIAAYLRGAAKAIFRGFCVLPRSDRGVSGGMGYRRSCWTRRAIVVFVLGCPGDWRGGDTRLADGW